MKLVVFSLLLLFAFSSTFGQNTEPIPNLLYENFVKAYDELDAEKLANLYTINAEALNLYDRSNPNSLKGKEDIKKYFAKFFQAIKDNNQKLQLTFKIIDRKKVGDNVLDNGFYRLEVLTPNKPSSFSFGKISTVLELQDGVWKFKTDATTNTDFIEYENAGHKTIPEREELLYPQYYDELLGDYVTETNQIIVIGRSQVRLYVYFEKTNEYRGLGKVNATTWTVGNAVRSDEVVQTFKFKDDKLEIYEKEKLIASATKKPFYINEKVTYLNIKGIKLGGTIFIPQKPSGKAIVLVHGSGQQDRNGYVSIIRLCADIFAREGITVLTYDKQGVGQSEGNSEYESFAELADDALGGLDYLKTRKDLRLTKIGLGGSSQAGWIIAKAIEKRKNDIGFALTIGAAGSGINVIDQNLYNTEVSMKCANIYAKTQIENALTQQRYFFDYLQNQSHAAKLDDFTKKIEKDTLIRDWLFPRSYQIDLNNRNQWFTALEINFNPLPIWKGFNKPTLMLFSEHDDSTPSKDVKSKVDNLQNKNIKTILLNNSQHIGLETNSVCRNDFADLTKFHKDFFANMKSWLKAL
ncbi:MAG: alpha/beta hydrolase [Saprospiraceae bacterium]|nr:alpha/beta hydrolase [Saprospiraceae bacterium]